MLVSDERTKLRLSDGKLLGNIPGNVDGFTLGLDVGTELGSLDEYLDGFNDVNLGGLFLGG